MKNFKLYTTVGIIESNDWNDIFKYVWHREDGPAIINYNGDGSIYYEQWYINGVLHREDGPASITYNEDGRIHYEQWRWCGLQHRHDYTKPASIYADGRCYYFWYGVYCTREELLDKNFRDRIQLQGLG